MSRRVLRAPEHGNVQSFLAAFGALVLLIGAFYVAGRDDGPRQAVVVDAASDADSAAASDSASDAHGDHTTHVEAGDATAHDHDSASGDHSEHDSSAADHEGHTGTDSTSDEHAGHDATSGEHDAHDAGAGEHDAHDPADPDPDHAAHDPADPDPDHEGHDPADPDPDGTDHEGHDPADPDPDGTDHEGHDGTTPDDGGHGGGHEPDPDATDPGEGGHDGHDGTGDVVQEADLPADIQAEVVIAREVAMNYPTAADASAAGWRKSTIYFPGIAAHYLKFSLLDEEFNLYEPEVLLYNGNGPDAQLVGVNYIVFSPGVEPAGFTGDYDHWHVHPSLCLDNGTGLVIGGENLSVADCAAIGGHVIDFSGFWLLHVWCIPGWTAPEGIFSHENSLV